MNPFNFSLGATQHFESCVRNAVRVKDARRAYNEQYPLSCEFCEGWGGRIFVNDPKLEKRNQVGISSVAVDDCRYCIGEGRCPRCSSNYERDDKGQFEPCSFCNFLLGVTEGKVYPHTCVCESLDKNGDETDDDDDD